MMAGVSGNSFPPFQSMPQVFKPALRRLRVSLELPEKTSMMNGRPLGLRRCPSRLKLQVFSSVSVSLVFAPFFAMPKPMSCKRGCAAISSRRSVN